MRTDLTAEAILQRAQESRTGLSRELGFRDNKTICNKIEMLVLLQTDLRVIQHLNTLSGSNFLTQVKYEEYTFVYCGDQSIIYIA